MEKPPVVFLVPVVRRPEKTRVLPAAAAEALFAELDLPEGAVLVIQRDKGAAGYASRPLDPGRAVAFLSEFGEVLGADAANRPPADRDKGSTVREMVPPVHLKCRTGDCGYQFWDRKPADQEPPACPKCHGPTSLVAP